MYNKAAYKILFTVTLVVLLTSVVFAQPGLPSPPSQAPIDGGLGILAAAGGAYAIKKLRERRGEGDEGSRYN